MKETVLKYARYNQWANHKIVNLLTNQAPEFIEKEITSSFPTIKKTILHIADAELIWHSRLANTPFPELPSKTDVSIEIVKDSNRLLIEYISSKDDAYFNDSTTYKNLKGEPFTSINNAIFMHVFNHATFHRGQLVSMLRNAGFNLPIESTDFISFERV
jgi:uncharacterized damage-inducible protein DinB